jgi:dihydroceramide fatty acyl 2-hydroxylase
MTYRGKDIRLFENDLLEKMTRVHPLAPLLVWLTVAFSMLFYSLFILNAYSLTSVALIAVGAFVLWTFVEYFLHRFAFHFQATSPLGKRIVYLIHGVHHDDPHDVGRTIMPLAPGLIYITILSSLLTLTTSLAFTLTFFPFFILAYLAYDYIHFAIHNFVPRTKLGRYFRRNHLIHHKRDHLRYGVTSNLWDWVFGTLYDKKK